MVSFRLDSSWYLMQVFFCLLWVTLSLRVCVFIIRSFYQNMFLMPFFQNVFSAIYSSLYSPLYPALSPHFSLTLPVPFLPFNPSLPVHSISSPMKPVPQVPWVIFRLPWVSGKGFKTHPCNRSLVASENLLKLSEPRLLNFEDEVNSVKFLKIAKAIKWPPRSKAPSIVFDNVAWSVCVGSPLSLSHS